MPTARAIRARRGRFWSLIACCLRRLRGSVALKLEVVDRAGLPALSRHRLLGCRDRRVQPPGAMTGGRPKRALGAVSADDGNRAVSSHRQRLPRGLRLLAAIDPAPSNGCRLPAAASESVTPNPRNLVHNPGNGPDGAFNLKGKVAGTGSAPTLDAEACSVTRSVAEFDGLFIFANCAF